MVPSRQRGRGRTGAQAVEPPSPEVGWAGPAAQQWEAGWANRRAGRLQEVVLRGEAVLLAETDRW